ncbi:hypothetical protein EMPS_09767 [Entomortierella parvispora]|uniref:Uncharacterized protein n=1 Tax=Entomortierella parvispora TaxID=205924 RepID=A0A9P3M0M1_9FUNG|nr:hypothetical protein EMPS_09767 [Entomortierella parvispora]
MGIGQMTIPLYVASLPEGMTFTINDVTKDVPANFWAYFSAPVTGGWPRTIQASEVATAIEKGQRGMKIGEFDLRTDGFGLSSGQGGSFLIKFTIAGRPSAHPEAEIQNIQGTLCIGTSEWGTFSRPDQTNFQWQIAGQSRTFTAKTPTLSYLDDTVIAIAYVPEQKNYLFGVTNEQTFIVKVMQTMVGGILTGHKVLWSTTAGMVASIGGAAFAVVAWGASKIDGI